MLKAFPAEYRDHIQVNLDNQSISLTLDEKAWEKFIIQTRESISKYGLGPLSAVRRDKEAATQDGQQSPLADQRRRQWQPTPVLLPGKSHGRRSLVGCSPWGG